MRRSLAMGVIAAVAWSPAIADAPRLRQPGPALSSQLAVAPPAHHGHHDHSLTALRPSAVIRYAPVVRVATPTPYAGSLPRLALPVPAPYFVVSGSPAAREIMTFAAAEPPQNWNWARVGSAAALVPRKVRDTCADNREYFPAAELCASP